MLFFLDVFPAFFHPKTVVSYLRENKFYESTFNGVYLFACGCLRVTSRAVLLFKSGVQNWIA